MTRRRIRSESEIRREAESVLLKKSLLTPAKPQPIPPEEAQETLHELRVHQVELEMQNDELQLAFAELEASRTRYSDLYNLAPVGYCTINKQGLILDANLTLTTMIGVVRGALISQPFARFILKEDQDIHYLHGKKIRDTGEPQSYDLRLVRYDDSIFWGHVATTKSFNREKLLVYRIVVEDITTRKFEEDERELTARLVAMIGSPGSFRECMLNLTSALKDCCDCGAVAIRYKDGNDYPYLEASGHSADFLLNENSLTTKDVSGKLSCDPDGTPTLRCLCGQVISGQTDSSQPGFTPSGSFWTNNLSALPAGSETEAQALSRSRCFTEGYESVALIPLRTSSQNLGLLQFTDTRQDRFTADLIAHFERMADTMTIALSQRQAEEENVILESKLQQAHKMEVVGRLAGGVAHDYNNMLMLILGNVDLILDDIKPSHANYSELMEIQSAATRSVVLTRQLLTFARKQIVTPKVIDLNEAVENMLAILRRLIGEDKDLNWRPGSDLWNIKIDPTQVEQILTNLCVNARDAIEGVGKIILKTENCTITPEDCKNQALAIPGNFVQFSVIDNGCGLDKKTMRLIFEPFYSTKDLGKGTGLGLATVYGIVSQNRGFITTTSALGEGMTIRIFFPRHEADSSNSNGPTRIKKTQKGHETILLVEDEPGILNMTTTMLQALGYTVLAADSPQTAIRLAEQNIGQIHLLATDIAMPGMNGPELADRLQSSDPKIRRLFISGFSVGTIAPRDNLETDLHYLQKPFTKNDLAEQVRKALDDR
jgi:PAS domain S-box-containing protein